MKMIIWQAGISGTGKEAALFLEENRIILFSNRAPQNIIDYCVVHHQGELKHALAVGQYLDIFNTTYEITAVGDTASNHLATLGHITLLFDGAEIPELPGTVHLRGNTPDRLLSEGTITIFEKQ